MKKYLIPLILLLAAALFAFPAAAAITADFSYSVDSSNPLTIHFTDKSIGGAGNWFWMFNDGGNAVSNERNPTFTFSSEGTYQIYLAVTDANYNGEATVRKWITISRSGITEDSGSSSSGSSSSGEAVPAAAPVSLTSPLAVSASPTRWTSSMSTSNSSGSW